MQSSGTNSSPETVIDTLDDKVDPGWMDLDDGWGLRSERRRPALVAELEPPPSALLTTDEIDDGWVLPDELSHAEAEPAEVDARVDAAGAKLDVNTAEFDQLCAVPGIGRLRARRILETRQRVGGFDLLDDLTKVKGIGAKTLDQLRLHLTV